MFWGSCWCLDKRHSAKKDLCERVYVDTKICSYRPLDSSQDTSDTRYGRYQTPTGMSYITCSRVTLVDSMNDLDDILASTRDNVSSLDDLPLDWEHDWNS